jgi:hypothetical protein
MAEAPEGIDAVRYDIALTNQHMAETAAELRQRLSEKKAQLASRVDVAEFAREHPWIALGIALSAGALLSGTGADAKAARAGVQAAKKSPRAAASLAKKAPGAAAGAAMGLVNKVRGKGNGSDVAGQTHELERARHHSSMVSRLRDQAGVFIEDLRAESETFAVGPTPGTAVGTFGAASPFHKPDGRA